MPIDTVAQTVLQRGHVGQHPARARQQHLPGWQQLHPARGAQEQLHAELRLQMADLPRQRRLGNMQAPRRAADVALLGNRDEVMELVEAHPGSLASSGPAAGRTAIPKRYWRTGLRPLQPEAVGIDLWGPSHHPALRRAGQAAAGTLSLIGRRLAPGTSTLDIDRWVRADTQRRGGRPSQLGYRPHPSLPAFPAAVCVSPDSVVCHGVPSAARVLEQGTIVNVDVTTELGGFHGDTSATFAIGAISPEARHVADVARRCRDAGIAVVRPGARLGDIGAAIEELAHAEGCSVVTEFGGHGIGRKMHAEPHVPHHGRAGTGLRLRPGMVFTIEPMVNLGQPDVRTLDDGWTVVTCDGSLSAQFEHTVLVTADGVEILTLTADEDVAAAV